ncbi:hypothetical protein K0M31_009140 [Melipona bicolor]|uniref:Uncharacterized protein n=1 Tax=Melipona bicolor TaxID=60889 RepID=A0AA40KJT4_9HYME|nr:hypothetical protein K0M31_009140 [Melipona bicolor]
MVIHHPRRMKSQTGQPVKVDLNQVNQPKLTLERPPRTSSQRLHSSITCNDTSCVGRSCNRGSSPQTGRLTPQRKGGRHSALIYAAARPYDYKEDSRRVRPSEGRDKSSAGVADDPRVREDCQYHYSAVKGA